MSAHFADPKENMLQLGLRDGMKVGDLGVGSGHYALAAAAAVAPGGHVYAVDIQEDVLSHMKDSAQRAGRRNIDAIWGDVEKPGGTKLRDQYLDAAVMSNTLFQLAHPEQAVAEARRILKPGGKLLLIDWAGAYGGMGPDPRHVVPEHKAEELFITGGFHKVRSMRAGPHHYGIIFTAP
jgi:ubiquinone/menaquinone biosynthesis C-methylase UbiE